MSYPVSSENTVSPTQIPASLIGDHKKPDQFRDYAAEARACVKELYRQHHTNQTLDLVLAKKAEYLPKKKAEMGIWEAMDHLNQFVDESDPDIELPQTVHALQTAEG